MSNNNKDQSRNYSCQNESTEAFEELISNIHKLRNKTYGCPWQHSQTHETLIPYLIEESYEFINSIKNKDPKNMKEELGDILLQIMLHAEIGKDKNLFSITEIINDLNKKIISRHPYIFKKRKKITVEEAQKIWKVLKNKEKFDQQEEDIFSGLNLEKFNSIQETEQIIILVDKYGFRWNDHKEIFEKLHEEIIELNEAIENNNLTNIEEEFGDTLFTLINLSSFLKLDINKCLRYANQKFKKRFSVIEKILGDRIFNQSKHQFNNLWKIAKEKLKETNLNSNEQ